MRAAVAKSQQCPGIGEHLADGLVIAADVVHHREKQVTVFGLGEIIVSDLVGRASLARGDGGNTRLLAGLVIWRISHHEELVPARSDELPELRQAAHFLCRRFLVEDAAPQSRVAQATALLGDAQAIKLPVARPDRERVERGTNAEHDADRPTGDLGGQMRALCARCVHRSQQPPPPFRIFVPVGQEKPHRATGFLG